MEVLSQINMGENKKGIIPESWKTAYTNFVDELHPLKKAVDELSGGADIPASINPYVLTRVYRGAAGKATHFLERSPFKFNSGMNVGKSLKSILEPVQNLDELRAYLVAKRGIELERRGILSGIRKSAMEKTVESLRDKYEKTAQQLYEYQNHLMDYYADAGLLDAKTLAAMREANRNYVPFYRFMGEESGGTSGGRGFSAQQQVKRIKGSGRDILDPLESIVKNTYALIQAAEKNQIGKALADLAELSGKPYGSIIEKLPTKMKGTSVSSEDVMRVLKGADEKAAKAFADAVERGDLDVSVFRPDYRIDKRTEISVFRDGKREICYIHHIGGLPDFTALRFTKYNQYESMILPMVKYLEGFGVQFHFGVQVTNVEFDCKSGRKVAKRIDILENGAASAIDLTENDLVFITNGGCVENSAMGSQNTPAPYNTEIKEGGGWDMWRKIAAQDPAFGHPDKFCYDPEQTNWMSATVETLDQRIIPYITKICKRDPFSGKVVTGGIVTVKDSSWLMSWTINRQPQFRSQPKDHCLVWVYSLFTDKPGDFVKKPMRECTGKEICMEWLYHLGVPVEQIEDMAENSANTVPVMMPYIDAFFMPRAYGDRPKVVPDGAVNFAFLGQFAETPRDTIFTTEYSMRTGMEAVYTLLNIDRGVPEVWGSVYDVRDLLDATVKLRDGKKPIDMELNLVEKMALKKVLGKIEGTDIEKLLKEYHII